MVLGRLVVADKMLHAVIAGAEAAPAIVPTMIPTFDCGQDRDMHISEEGVQLFASFGALRNFTTLFPGRAESVQVLLNHYLLDENVGCIEHRNISLRCSPLLLRRPERRLPRSKKN